MENAPPELSVIMLTYNRSSMIAKFLASFASQTVPSDSFEVTVSDDGSKDDTEAATLKVAKDYHDDFLTEKWYLNVAVNEGRTMPFW